MSAAGLSGKLRTVFRGKPWTALKWGLATMLIVGWYLPAVQTLAGESLGDTWLIIVNRMVLLAAITMVAITAYRARNAVSPTSAPPALRVGSRTGEPVLVDLRER